MPTPLARIESSSAFPFPWSVHSWREGEAGAAARTDSAQVESDLVAVLRALHSLDPEGPPSTEAYCC